MGKPTRNELLAEYYLRAAGVAAVWIDATGHVGAQDVASIENEPGRTVYCCERGVHFILAYRLFEWKKAGEVDLAAVIAKLDDLADRGGVGLTPHAVAVDRALTAVAAVNETIDKMGSTGELKAFNRAFKEARRIDPIIPLSSLDAAAEPAIVWLANRPAISDLSAAKAWWPCAASFPTFCRNSELLASLSRSWSCPLPPCRRAYGQHPPSANAAPPEERYRMAQEGDRLSPTGPMYPEKSPILPRQPLG